MAVDRCGMQDSLKMNILYLAHRIPYPPNKGDKIRSFNEIKYLSQFHTIDLACLVDEPGDMRHCKDVKEFCRRVFLEPLHKVRATLRGIFFAATGKPISVGYFYSRAVQNIVDEWLSDTNYDWVICFSSSMAEYVFRSRSRTNVRLAMDFCDVDSDKWGQYAQRSHFPKSIIFSLENRLLGKYERRVADSFDCSLFVSEKEAEIFETLTPGIGNIHVVPNGVDHEYFNPAVSSFLPAARTVESDHRPTLVFTGAMDYYANEDAMAWFCGEILPKIKSRLPEIQLFIVGRNPTGQVASLDDGRTVHVTGCVDDVRPYYALADVCVIPLRIARGVQNKVLEAMAMGKAIVTTPVAVQGIQVLDGEQVLLADNAEAFVDTLLRLLSDDEWRDQIGKRAAEHVAANYSWQAKMTLMNNLLYRTSLDGHSAALSD